MNDIQKYFRYRQHLIDQYIRGDMTKSEYLHKNLDAVLQLKIEPFKYIDTAEKGLFNYQYYNAMAKESKTASASTYDFELAKESLEESNYYYYQKDKSTIALLKLLDYEHVTAYYIRVRSKYLKGKLMEIYIEDYDAILHSKSPTILNLLQKAGVFSEGTRTSLIDGYINQRY